MTEDVLAPWRPAAGQWDRAAAAHLLRRAGFGARPGGLERACERGLAGTLEDLLTAREGAELRASARSVLATGSLELLQAWWMALILSDGAALRERMTLVWHDHFATSNDKVQDVRLMHGQNELLREHGLGDFRRLLLAVARDPAMLVWLDGNSNRRGHPNENFARELMELFALGIGHYAEDDVREAARALSGWGTEGRSALFRPEQHDEGEKVLFGQRGPWSAEQAVELVLAQPACSRHVARTLLVAFVAPDPDEAWVEGLASVLREGDWNVAHALEVLLASELFFSPRARRSRIAGPVELVAASARALDAGLAPRRAARMAAAMGQALFRPPSVAGWDGGRAWINSGSWIARHNALLELVQPEDAEGLRVDLTRALGDDAAADVLPARVLATLLPEGDGELARELAHLARAAHEPGRARELCTALVLTAPEYHLF